ncbi:MULTISPECIES: ABC transporter ATP-binding protein [unclassified Plantactinospora]|uniref:ABC transporter ATP-binding protein n=1 Tax=unclassified Plantactinospora TaxID=2631981 RepID=UPI000D169D6B|nr:MULTISPECIES: ABC transporter ATP-binding protein [unclassified Plantactinospora]AVT29255.1 ABC transporter ATP-binding protein [Plantactinospora sp. BC1]AVT35667.1 ABC transporter ATP-binding protein [Plantactinospora sp. BB1]
MLTVRDLHVDYAGVVALRGVDLRVEAGELVALVGANGAGKSTLLAAVSGLHRPVRGSVTFLDEDVSGLPAYRIARRGAVLVPEGRRLFGHQTVLQNLLLGGYHRTATEREADLARVYDLFPVLAERAGQRAGTLSGGEQQMVALGRALMSRPKLLMLDEPSLGISPKFTKMIFEVLAEIRRAGTTMLLVEQNLRAALELADRAYVLQTGEVVMAGPADELAASDEVRRSYLGL